VPVTSSKQVLLQIYESFRKENGFEIADGDEGVESGPGVSDGADGSDADPREQTAG